MNSWSWLTPNVQKGISLTFVVVWLYVHGRFALFWQALTGKVVVNA